MEKKLQIALCALLFINLGSTVQGQDSLTPPLPSKGTDSEKAPYPGQSTSSSGYDEAAGSMPGISLGASLEPQTTNTTTSSSESTHASSSSNNTNTEAEPASSIPPDHYPISMDLPEIPTLPGKNTNLSEQSPPQPTLDPSENQTATTHISRSTTTTHTVHHSSPVTPTPPITSPHIASSHVPPIHQTSASSPPTHPSTHHPKTTIPTSAPNSESPGKLHPGIETDTTTAISIQSISTISTHRETTVTPVTSLPSPQSDSHPETSSPTHTESTFSQSSSSSGQAKPHVNTPSQLNMGGDATVVHESATPDPLLAGLVSAFIITAVIITLLLFLKLRRRDNRPEFRRLQDLPMDDMMEDTPLSMYSY